MKATRFSHKNIFSNVFFPLFILFTCLNAANAAEVTLAWDANSEDNLAGYKLYYAADASDGASYGGTGLAEGDSPVVINIEDLSDASAPVFSLSGLEEGRQYFFALTAFDTDTLESDYSDEVAYEVGTAAATYAITASATEGGTISPVGTEMVTAGDTRTFIITPNDHYHIVGVTVDGSPVGQVTDYTFQNVSAAHTISASFEIDTYTVTATAGDNGAISPAGVSSVDYGASLAVTVIPDTGYHVADVLVDGSSVGAVAGFSFDNITTWHTIAAAFEADVASTSA